MVGEELKQHLKQTEAQLTDLINTYYEYESRNSQNEQKKISLFQHMVNLLAIIVITILFTFTIATFLIGRMDHFGYIAIGQAFLSIGFYLFFVQKNRNITKKPPYSTTSNKSVFELDQQRFSILQELARSPIPQAYITPTAIKNMHLLVTNGKCFTMNDCIAQMKIEQEKHKKEFKLIQRLHMISYV